MAHLFALHSVDAGEQGGDDAFLKLQFLSEAGDFGGQIGDLLVLLFDAL